MLKNEIEKKNQLKKLLKLTNQIHDLSYETMITPIKIN
jgi:hypothetical protein